MAVREGRLEFRLLGPFEVSVDGAEINLGGPRLRGMVARLLVDAGRTVSPAALVEELWAGHPPRDARRTVRRYVSSLRTTMSQVLNGYGGGLLVVSPPGYCLHVASDTTDSGRFEQLAAAGRRYAEAGAPQLAHQHLVAALSLWRGPALAEFDQLPAVSGEGARLDKLRLEVIEERNDAALALGLHDQMVDDLRVLVRAYPSRERLWQQLMTALHGRNRRAEALAYPRSIGGYAMGRSPALAEIREQTAHAPSTHAPSTHAPSAHAPSLASLAGASPQARATGRAYPIPAHLPPGVRDFTGRIDELAQLDALLPASPAPTRPASAALAAAAARALRVTLGAPRTSKITATVHHLRVTTAAEAARVEQLRGVEGAHAGGATQPADVTHAGSATQPADVTHAGSATQPTDVTHAGSATQPTDVTHADSATRAGDAVGALAGTQPVLIAVVCGTAGVGKTALAVHWAHRAASAFPDGQLYADLRGFDPVCSVMDPAEALRHFLEALGVAAREIPADLTARAAMYRSLLAGKRILVLLDNVRDAEQVRPLLPGADGCLAIVTSRNLLTPLVATEGAQPVTLGLLDSGQARELFVRRVGEARAAADPQAMQDIVTRCAGLPLALAVAAARVAVNRDLPLPALAAEIGAASSSLDALDGGDPGSDVRAVFSWSYQTLGPEAARLFRLLGLHPGPDLSIHAAASLAGTGMAATRAVMAALGRAHLVSEHTPSRFACHDLLRAYAREMAIRDESEPDRRAAVHRVLDHYLYTAYAGALRLKPYTDSLVLDGPTSGVSVVEPHDYETAMAWFSAEYRVLLAAIDEAYANGFDRHTWQLAAACTSFLHRANHWGDLATIHQVAHAAATRSDDTAGQAHAQRGLGLAERGLGRLDEARDRVRSALDLFVETGDESGMARTLENLFWIESATGRWREALDCARQSLDLFRATGDKAGQATALNNIGWCYAHGGEYREALAWCLHALDLQERSEDRYCQAHTWDSLGFIHHHLGNHERAVACYHRALHMFRHTGDHYSEATGEMYLGDTHRDAGDLAAARQAWQSAQRILIHLNHPDVARLNRRLAETATT
jgi:DNA-binding SARP family transcriptional activator/tetratricopeptide (TPR) repeat protein